MQAFAILFSQTFEQASYNRTSSTRHRSPEEITVFDSTGLAIQDLAIGIEVVNRYREGANASRFSAVQEINIG